MGIMDPQKKKKPNSSSTMTEKMGVDRDMISYDSPSKLADVSQGVQLGMMMRNAAPNMADIEMNNRTNAINHTMSGQDPGMERVKNGIARKTGQPKSTLFGS